MEKLAKLIKILGYLDYVVSAGLLAYGLFAQAWLYAAAGAVGLVLAYLKPAERLKDKVTAKFVRKTGTAAAPAPDVTTPAVATPRVAVALRYAPRSRYPATAYFVAYTDAAGASRMPVEAPRDLRAILARPADRLQLGVRAEKIHPR